MSDYDSMTIYSVSKEYAWRSKALLQHLKLFNYIVDVVVCDTGHNANHLVEMCSNSDVSMTIKSSCKWIIAFIFLNYNISCLKISNKDIEVSGHVIVC
jgi:hypothetical protein